MGFPMICSFSYRFPMMRPFSHGFPHSFPMAASGAQPLLASLPGPHQHLQLAVRRAPAAAAGAGASEADSPGGSCGRVEEFELGSARGFHEP